LPVPGDPSHEPMLKCGRALRGSLHGRGFLKVRYGWKSDTRRCMVGQPEASPLKRTFELDHVTIVRWGDRFIDLHNAYRPRPSLTSG
jgi:hypothetical protein